MPVAWLEDTMSAQELTEWMAYLSIDAQVKAMAKDGTTYEGAYETCWTPRDEAE